MKNVILIANAGSSSLKISVFEIKDKKIKDKIYNIFLEKNNTKIVFHLNHYRLRAGRLMIGTRSAVKFKLKLIPI